MSFEQADNGAVERCSLADSAEEEGRRLVSAGELGYYVALSIFLYRQNDGFFPYILSVYMVFTCYAIPH